MIARGFLFWKEGKRDQAQALFAKCSANLKKLEERGDEDITRHLQQAEMNAITGDTAAAYAALEKYIEAGAFEYRYLAKDPMLENLRNESRFQQMLTRIKKRVEDMRNRAQRSIGMRE